MFDTGEVVEAGNMVDMGEVVGCTGEGDYIQ